MSHHFRFKILLVSREPFFPQSLSPAVCNQPDIHCSELSSKNQLRSLAPAKGITSRRLLHKACLFWHALASPLWALTLAAAALSALINDCQNTGGKVRVPDAAPRYLTPLLIRASASKIPKQKWVNVVARLKRGSLKWWWMARVRSVFGMTCRLVKWKLDDCLPESPPAYHRLRLPLLLSLKKADFNGGSEPGVLVGNL